MNVNDAAAITNNEYKDVLMYEKCLRHSMNSIQSKDNKIELIKSAGFLFLVLMIKYTSRTMNVMD